MAHKPSPLLLEGRERRRGRGPMGIAKIAVCTGEERRKLLKSFRHMQSIFPIPIIE